ncbi:choice-of-anchor L domain-containing protein [Caenimonas koreensis]|uniref:Uncharacterized protein n=1 Tax=Caenimonas koreensis DSM 17982 TaxID=1121255 RepID=A0A844ANZ3_9BURK|nr:choice-of-anchor L domain-containing protein [Caenimonas koreensis]MRD45700.1 hypothetical protein [Caenimonas koreensis DSM 17982]
MAFTTFDPANDSLTSLVHAIFNGSPGASLVGGSITTRTGVPIDPDTGFLSGDPSTIAFYSGSISQLGIGAGLLLTTGDPTPPGSNSSTFYGNDTGADQADADLQATINAAFSGAGSLQDLTYLQFHINVTDPNATGLRFDVVFASDEFPEFSNTSFVDVAGVYVNGVNYALFNNNPLTPLSVVQANLNAGNFITNSGQVPIEYDGVSIPLQVTAPLHMGDNLIKIAIADTGDSFYDSAIFVSGLQAVNYQGFGLSQQVEVEDSQEVLDTGGNQTYLGSALRNLIKLISGQDVVDGGAGLDEVEIAYALNSYSWNGATLNLNGVGGNSSQLINVERVDLSAYGYLVATDTSPGGDAYGAVALLDALLNTTFTVPLSLPNLTYALDPLSHWIKVTDDVAAGGGTLGNVATQMLAAFVPGASQETIIGSLYQNIFGAPADAGIISYVESFIGSTFPTIGDLFAFAALLPQNTADLTAAGFTGSILVLNPAEF